MKKALLILSPGFPADEQDTTCLPLQQQLVLAMNHGFPEIEIIVVAFRYPHRGGSYDWNGNTIYCLDSADHGTAYNAWELNKIIRRSQAKYELIGLLSFWHDACALAGHWFGKLYRLRHRNWILGQDARPGNRYERKIAAHEEELVALSDHVRDSFEKNYAKRPRHLIPPGIDHRLFGNNAANRDIGIIGIGNLIPLKQYDLFIDFVAGLVQKYPDISTVIIGKGTEQEQLRQRISDLGLEANIKLTGELPHPEVIRMLERSRILFHPSSYEGYGVVIDEALYAGAHVISFVQPMHTVADHHHVVSGTGEAIKICERLLSDERLDHSRVPVSSIGETANSMMRLFLQ